MTAEYDAQKYRSSSFVALTYSNIPYCMHTLFSVSDATITPHTLNFVKKLVSTFGIGIENVSAVSQQFSTAASESLARRAQMTAQDPVFQKMKQQFTKDFDFKVSGATKLHNLIVLLKKWIKLLEAKTKLLPK